MKKIIANVVLMLTMSVLANAAPGIWLEWRVDDGTAGNTATGTAVDSSGNSRAGTYQGNGTWSSDTKTGSGTSFHVDGIGDYVLRNPSTADGFGITDWSAENRVYEIDFKITDEVQTGTQYILDEYTHDGNYGGVWMRAARVSSTSYNLWTGLRGGSGANTWQSSVSIAVGQWYHAKVVLIDLSGTVFANDAEFYLDGVKQTANGDYAGVSATGNSSAYRVSIGATGSGGSAMGGYVDNLVISN